MFNEIKKYLSFKTVLDKFVFFIQLYIVLALLNLIDFSLPKWWLYSNNPDFYRAFFVVISIFLVDITFFAFNFYYLKVKGLNLLNVGLTGAFTYLVLHPLLNPIWLPAFCAFVAIFIRYFVRYKGRPVFNPAAIGMFVTYCITWVLMKLGILKTTLFISWWSADFGKKLTIGNFSIAIHWLVFIPIFSYFVYKYRRHWLGISFFISIIIFQFLNFLFLKNYSLNQTLLLISGGLGTWIFMSLLMVVEPKTSPVFKKDQIIIGALGGLILTALYRIESLPAHEIVTILILNLLTLLLARIKLKFKNNFKL